MQYKLVAKLTSREDKEECGQVDLALGKSTSMFGSYGL